ncbi:DUF2207 domain-containing protein [Nocardioides sp.]|uniref:DUF2207 domain-containing protein n=1 Tax=Nocardioides sp. TaxID=35761 RepID=UPI00260A4DEC|nr:DUF2207 domain-containing protein [Nocardioides sp.]
MNRFVLYVLGIVVMAGLILAPALFWSASTSSSSSVAEPTSISRYDAQFTLTKAGDLSAVETIDLDVTTGDRHGLFRFFDRLDPNAPHARRTPRDLSVTQDGVRAAWSTHHEDGARYLVVQIGDPDRYLSQGTHRYVIRYTIPGVLLKAAGGQSTFYWNVVSGGWQQQMSNVDVTVHLPVAAAPTVRCITGNGTAGAPCTASGAGTTTLALHLDSLAARTPVTLMTTLAMATPPEGGHLPWTIRWDRVLGTHVWLVGLVVLLGVAGALLGAWLGSKAREKEPPFPLVYAPPAGLDPAQGAYLLRETIPRQAYIATLLDGAQRGTVALERSSEGWTLAPGQTPAEKDDLAAISARRLAGEGTFTAGKRDVESGKRLQSELAAFKSAVKLWALEGGYLSKTGFDGIGMVAVFGGLALLVLNVLFNPFGMTLLGVIPGAFAIFGVSMAATGAGTRRTRSGRELWSQLGGFRRVLSTPSSKDRFEFSGRTDLYTAYIPWAVAFDCAREWAEKYRVETGSEPPVPTYFGGYYAAGLMSSGDLTSSLVADFDSTVNSAIASYSATQSSSSGGGGFSGGGGGGGGGGGSW